MFNELIEIDKEGNVFLQDNSIALMPKLWAVYKDKYGGSKMVRWIVAMDDYKSPYRKLPEEERFERLCYMIFDSKSSKKCKSKEVVEARNEYKMLQFDPLIDQYNAMSEKMFLTTQIFKTIIPTKENLDEVNDMQTKMHKAAEAREKIKQMIIDSQENQVTLQGTGSEDFSMFEQDEMLGK